MRTLCRMLFVCIICMILIVSCCGIPATVFERQHVSINDARDIPVSSFILLESHTFTVANDCMVPGCKMFTSESNASGIVVGRSRTVPGMAFVLTAAHFCDNRSRQPDENRVIVKHRFVAYDYYGRKHAARYYISSHEDDTCIVSVFDLDDSVISVSIARMMPVIGERVFNASAPRAFFAPKLVLIFEGLYSGISPTGAAIYTIPTTVGASGSAVFNTSGSIVGIITGYPVMKDRLPETRVVESLAYAVPLSRVRDIVEACELIDATSGASTSTIAVDH